MTIMLLQDMNYILEPLSYKTEEGWGERILNHIENVHSIESIQIEISPK